MNDSMPYAFRHALIYDWYDGPTEGLAKNHAGKTVWFLEVVAARRNPPAFLLTPVPERLYESLAARYGRPPEDPCAGIVIVIEHDDDSEDVRELERIKLSATEGTVVRCRSDGDMESIEEFPAPEPLVRRLMGGEAQPLTLDDLPLPNGGFR